MIALAHVLAIIAVFGLLPTTVLFTEILISILIPNAPAPEDGPRLPIAVVMPAHDEATIIVNAVRSVLSQLGRCDRLVVIADNCSDDTAVIAEAEGAEVIVRNDSNRRGKGFALDYAIRHLEANPPGVVIVIDADCTIADGSLDRLARKAARTVRPIQALYLMYAPRGAGAMARVAQFAWTVKNLVRPLGLYGMGLPCQLMGTGMAFPWACINSADLATGHIAEDLKLGVELARMGSPPLFCPEAVVMSYFPVSREGLRTQRTRWEHGHMGLILSDVPRQIFHSFRTVDGNLMALALDLSVPPLALLALFLGVVWVTCALFDVITNSRLPFEIASCAAALLVLSVLSAWARYGRDIISLRQLLLSVPYAILKAPLYAKFLIAREAKWVRSKRNDDRT